MTSHAQTLTDVFTERLLIAALISNPELYGLADEIGAEDLTSYHCKHVLAAIRHLHDGWDAIDVVAIAGVFDAWDAKHDTHLADKCGLVWLVDLVLWAPISRAELMFEHDVWWLRELTQRRRYALAESEFLSASPARMQEVA